MKTPANSIAKRAFDVFFAAVGLVLLSPLLLSLAIAVWVTDGLPILFRQQRIGLGGTPFTILKFRSMALSEAGPAVTVDGDPRITGIGRFMRKAKLDELPQLWNVLRGEMSFVGPRPEVPRYVAVYTPAQRRVLELKPGITDLATLLYRDEEALLARSENVEHFYVCQVLPHKLELNLAYARHAGLWEDTKIVFRTLLPGLPLASKAEKLEQAGCNCRLA